MADEPRCAGVLPFIHSQGENRAETPASQAPLRSSVNGQPQLESPSRFILVGVFFYPNFLMYHIRANMTYNKKWLAYQASYVVVRDYYHEQDKEREAGQS